MEHLTRTQIVLLTLLVTFVTSITTGIVTVSLLDQAPIGVTQSINKVIERTVEKVISPPSGENNQGASLVTKETTIVVKEEDLITESIAKNAQAIVRISRGVATSVIAEATSSAGSPFIGLGIVVPGGIVATDASLVGTTVGGYIGLFADGRKLALKRLETPKGYSTALFSIVAAESPGDATAPVPPRAVSFADSSALKLGQSVISLSGRERSMVATGIIAALDYDTVSPPSLEGQKKNDEKKTAPELQEVLSGVTTTIVPDEVIAGSPLVNIFGELVGVWVQTSSGKHRYTPVNLLSEQLATVPSQPTETPVDNQGR